MVQPLLQNPFFWIKTVIFTLTNKDRPNSNRTKQDWVTGPESHQQQQPVCQPATNQRTVGTDTNLVDQNMKPSQVKVLNVDAVFTPTKLLYLRFYIRCIYSFSQSVIQTVIRMEVDIKMTANEGDLFKKYHNSKST